MAEVMIGLSRPTKEVFDNLVQLVSLAISEFGDVEADDATNEWLEQLRIACGYVDQPPNQPADA